MTKIINIIYLIPNLYFTFVNGSIPLRSWLSCLSHAHCFFVDPKWCHISYTKTSWPQKLMHRTLWYTKSDNQQSDFWYFSFSPILALRAFHSSFSKLHLFFINETATSHVLILFSFPSWGSTQLHILNSRPNSSPSPRVCGSGWLRVSGRKREVTPPRTQRTPIMVSGRALEYTA